MKSELAMESLENSIHYIIDHINRTTEDVQTIGATPLYSSYTGYCDTNGFKAYNSRKFLKDLDGLGIPKTRQMRNGTRENVYTIDRTIIERKLQETLNDATFKFDDLNNMLDDE